MSKRRGHQHPLGPVPPLESVPWLIQTIPIICSSFGTNHSYLELEILQFQEVLWNPIIPQKNPIKSADLLAKDRITPPSASL